MVGDAKKKWGVVIARQMDEIIFRKLAGVSLWSVVPEYDDLKNFLAYKVIDEHYETLCCVVERTVAERIVARHNADILALSATPDRVCSSESAEDACAEYLQSNDHAHDDRRAFHAQANRVL